MDLIGSENRKQSDHLQVIVESKLTSFTFLMFTFQCALSNVPGLIVNYSFFT